MSFLSPLVAARADYCSHRKTRGAELLVNLSFTDLSEDLSFERTHPHLPMGLTLILEASDGGKIRNNQWNSVHEVTPCEAGRIWDPWCLSDLPV